MRYKVLMAGLLLATLLCGCQAASDSIDEAYKELNNQGGNEQSVEEHITTESQTPIPKTLEYKVVSTSSKTDFEVEATVITDGHEGAEVIPIEKDQIDEEYLRNLASLLFDNGAYTVEKPYIVCTDAELNEARDELMADMEIDANCLYPEAIEELETLIENYDPARTMDMTGEDVIVNVEQYGSMFPNTNFYYGPREFEMVMDVATLEGTIDDKMYQLCYGKYDYGTTLKLRILEPVTVAKAVCSMDSEAYESVSGENACDLDEARKIADETMLRLGFSNFEEYSIGKRNCHTAYGQSFIDGYVICYTRTINDVANSVSDNTYVLTQQMMDEGALTDYGQEYVLVKVDHTGLIGMSIYNPYKIASESPVEVKLMDFSQIDEIAQSTMKDILDKVENDDATLVRYYDRLGTSPGAVDQVKFTYMPMIYNGKLSYVPMWM